MKTKLHYLFIVLTLLALAALNFTTAFAQSTAFSYQGRLNYGARPPTTITT
jgi:hypothetical protein